MNEKTKKKVEAFKIKAHLVAHGAKVDPAVLKKISDMTRHNLHTEALVELARDVLKDRKLTKATESLLALHEYFGSMPPDLGKVRNIIYDRAMKMVRGKFPKDVADEVYNAFS